MWCSTRIWFHVVHYRRTRRNTKENWTKFALKISLNTPTSGTHTRKNILWRRPSIYTVKVSNFGPHGNFGPFFASSVASFDESCTKYEQKQIRISYAFLQLLFSSFFSRMRFNDSRPFWKRGPKFPWGPKLGAFTVPFTVFMILWVLILQFISIIHKNKVI